MSDRWKIGLAVLGIALTIPLYLMLRPPGPKSDLNTSDKELVCIDESCGFRRYFTEAEAVESVREHGFDNRTGVDLFHCPSCKRRSLYRSELEPLPFTARDLFRN